MSICIFSLFFFFQAEDGIRDIGVTGVQTCALPIYEGGLTGRITPETKFEEGDFRNEYFKGDRKKEVYERVRGIAEDLDVEEEKIPEIALRYVLSHPAVSTVIPGMRDRKSTRLNSSHAN